MKRSIFKEIESFLGHFSLQDIYIGTYFEIVRKEKTTYKIQSITATHIFAHG